LDLQDSEILDKIHRWLVETVEVPRPELSGFPICPFARQARINCNVKYVIARRRLREEIETQIAAYSEQPEFVTVIIEPNPKAISSLELANLVEFLRQSVSQLDLHLMWDHPDAPENVNGVSFNHGDFILVFLQRKSRLNAAAKELHQKGYYSTWPLSFYNEVVFSRSPDPSMRSPVPDDVGSHEA
jgi:hypothetical protein